MASKRTKHGELARMLNNLSPLPTLDRGYAILRDDEGSVISDVAGVSPETSITAQLRDGQVIAEVKAITTEKLEAPDVE